MRGFLQMLFLFVFSQPVLADEAPIIAVFDVDSQNGPEMSVALRNSLRDFVEGLLVQSGEYQAVPAEQLQDGIAKAKRKTGDPCYKRSCQIELGKALAASKTVALQVNKIGSTCTVRVSVFDLRKETTDKTAVEETACTEDGYLLAFRRSAERLVGEAPDEVVPEGDAGRQVPIRTKASEALAAASPRAGVGSDWFTLSAAAADVMDSFFILSLEVLRFRHETFQWSVGSCFSGFGGPLALGGLSLLGAGAKHSFGEAGIHEVGFLWFPLSVWVWDLPDYNNGENYIERRGFGFLHIKGYYRFAQPGWHFEAGLQSPMYWVRFINGGTETYPDVFPITIYLGGGI